MSTSNFYENLGETIGYVEAYTERKIDILKLESSEHLSKLTALLATGAILLSMFAITCSLFSIGLALYLAEALDLVSYQAFFLVMGIYVVLSILIFLFRKTIITKPILTVIVSAIYR
ncbi:MAG: hypothetical protein C7N36_18645 [Bacteroidetes bacterium]|nr:MAG: hypothetical protein C7N36_18645 [Bacteroidota bacterium]